MGHRILIIDDEEDIRTVAAIALDMHGDLEVRTCGCGMEGLQIADWWQPDLIMLDARMPGLSGPETLKSLRSGGRTERISVVFFTASAGKKEKEDLVALGAQGLISKPFDPMTLSEQIAPFLPRLAMNAGTLASGATQGLNSDDVLVETVLMTSLLYVSCSNLGEGEAAAEIQRIVATARTRNSPLGISGALIFTGTHFAQFLEGPSVKIDLLMAAIRQDERHRDLRLVPTPPYSRRSFSDWSMAYGGSSLFVSRLVASAFQSQSADHDSKKLIRLMREFTNDQRNAA